TSAPPQPSAIHSASGVGLVLRRHTAPACSIRSSSRAIFCDRLKSFSYNRRRSYPERSSCSAAPGAVCVVAVRGTPLTPNATKNKTARVCIALRLAAKDRLKLASGEQREYCDQ